MLSNAFNSSDFTTLNGGSDISNTVEAQNATWMQAYNGTPYNFVVSNAGAIVAMLPPFTFTTWRLPPNVERLTVASMKAAATYTPSGVTVSNWLFYTGVFIDEPPHVNYKVM